MVDNVIDGIYAHINRINPESLSKEAKLYLKTLRESLKSRQTIDKSIGNLLARTIIKYHNDTGEDIVPLLLELVTVSYYAIDPLRAYVPALTHYLLLGELFSALTVTREEQELITIAEQIIIGIFTNPIFEFDYRERAQVVRNIYQVQGYMRMLSFHTGRFRQMLPLIEQALLSGLEQALEICNVTTEEQQAALSAKDHRGSRFWGRCLFYLHGAWPMFNINSSTILSWINKRTGIELWPIKEQY